MSSQISCEFEARRTCALVENDKATDEAGLGVCTPGPEAYMVCNKKPRL